MTFVPASFPSLVAFQIIVSAVIAMGFIGVSRASASAPALRSQRLLITTIVAIVWLGAFTAAVSSGFIAAQPMPRLLILFATVNVVSVAIALSPIGQWLASGLSIGALVAFHAFRLPLELVLHNWVNHGTIPATMTWTGANWDIVTGLLALAVAPFASQSRQLAWAFNFIGLGLLLNVIRVALLSSPLPFAWQLESPLQLAFHIPYALIAPVCIGGALIGHIVLFRALLQKPRGLEL